jgi:AraC-like DNA-binding protein
VAIRVTAYDGWDEIDWPAKALEAGYRMGTLARLVGERCLRRFRRKFRRFFDMLPKRKLMQWRGELADRLQAQGLRIGKISRQLHFYDRSHFGRDHRRRHGVSASHLRREERRRREPVYVFAFGRVFVSRGTWTGRRTWIRGTRH